MDFVNGKDDIPYMKWKIKAMFQTTNQNTVVFRNSCLRRVFENWSSETKYRCIWKRMPGTNDRRCARHPIAWPPPHDNLYVSRMTAGEGIRAPTSRWQAWWKFRSETSSFLDKCNWCKYERLVQRRLQFRCVSWHMWLCMYLPGRVASLNCYTVSMNVLSRGWQI